MRIDTVLGAVAGVVHQSRVAEAYLVDLAEIGAALGSGDRELADKIEVAFAGKVDLRTDSTNGQSHSECLVELLEGGALADENVQGYTDAFAMICEYLGQAVELSPWDLPDAAMMTECPFDVPTDPDSTTIALIDPALATATIGEHAQGRSAILFFR